MIALFKPKRLKGRTKEKNVLLMASDENHLPSLRGAPAIVSHRGAPCFVTRVIL
jgi:hypothetical protein